MGLFYVACVVLFPVLVLLGYLDVYLYAEKDRERRWDQQMLLQIEKEIARYKQNEGYLASLANDADGNAQLIEALQTSQKKLLQGIDVATVMINSSDNTDIAERIVKAAFEPCQP